MRNKTIRYAIDSDSGLVVSENMETGEMAIPVLDFAGIGQGGNGFAKGDFHGPMNYELQKIGDRERHSLNWRSLYFTKKIPLSAKNLHRKFWGMKPITRKPTASEAEGPRYALPKGGWSEVSLKPTKLGRIM